jgi:hypothetical protein
MPLLYIILGLAALGLVLYLVNAYIPMDATVRRVLNIVVIVLLALWALKAFGLWDALLSIRV